LSTSSTATGRDRDRARHSDGIVDGQAAPLLERPVVERGPRPFVDLLDDAEMPRNDSSG
jgi:hypothetical protein